MQYRKHSRGLLICGDAHEKSVTETVDAEFGEGESCVPQFPLIICDPPYGDILPNVAWDKADYPKWMKHCAEVASNDATICMWGGVGKRHSRAFLLFASLVEEHFPAWEIKNWITWGKRRAYGVKDNYLFTREECLILTRGKPTFNIPLLEVKRGYAGYNPKYPAKSEFLRRTNVWSDVTEMFSGKVHPAQKPDRLYEILIATHSNAGDVIYDPCAGSCTTARVALALGRRYCVIEKEMSYLLDSGMWELKKERA